MERRGALVTTSAAQLALGVAGMAIAVRRRHPYDTPLRSGRAENVVRDSVLMGTALSAPVVMLIAQTWATARLARGESQVATALLAGLGATMVAGYVAERQVRRRLRPAGWDPIESSLVVAGLSASATMAVLGGRDLTG